MQAGNDCGLWAYQKPCSCPRGCACSGSSTMSKDVNLVNVGMAPTPQELRAGHEGLTQPLTWSTDYYMMTGHCGVL